MPFVRSRPGGDVDDSAGVAPVLCAAGRIISLELLHSVDGRLKRNLILSHVVEVDAVNLKIDGVFTIARRVESERTLTAQRRCQISILRRRDRAGQEQPQINEVAAIEWNLLHSLLVNDSANGGRRCLNDRRIGNNAHRLRDVADSELKVLDDGPPNFHAEAIDDVSLKPCGLDLNAIDPDRQGCNL